MIARILLTALAVLGIGELLGGVEVQNYTTAIIVAVVLGLLQAFVEPILRILALPITIITLGLFSFVINAAIILMGAHLVDGFSVDGFWNALIFSLLLSCLQSLLYSFFGKNKKKD